MEKINNKQILLAELLLEYTEPVFKYTGMTAYQLAGRILERLDELEAVEKDKLTNTINYDNPPF